MHEGHVGVARCGVEGLLKGALGEERLGPFPQEIHGVHQCQHSALADLPRHEELGNPARGDLRDPGVDGAARRLGVVPVVHGERAGAVALGQTLQIRTVDGKPLLGKERVLQAQERGGLPLGQAPLGRGRKDGLRQRVLGPVVGLVVVHRVQRARHGGPGLAPRASVGHAQGLVRAQRGAEQVARLARGQRAVELQAEGVLSGDDGPEGGVGQRAGLVPVGVGADFRHAARGRGRGRRGPGVGLGVRGGLAAGEQGEGRQSGDQGDVQ